MIAPMDYLTTQDVCGRLASLGVDEATVGRVFAARPAPGAPARPRLTELKRKPNLTGAEEEERDSLLEQAARDDLEYRRTFDYDRKFVLGVPVPGRKAVLLVYRFGCGEPLLRDPAVEGPQETGPNWRPRWISVEGPFPLDQDAISAKARELTQ